MAKLTKNQPISSRSDFQTVFRCGRRVQVPGLSVHFLNRKDNAGGRFAVMVSKKNGGAVQRNKIRRRIKEAVRSKGGVPLGWDGVVVARKGVENLTYPDIAVSIWKIMENLGDNA